MAAATNLVERALVVFRALADFGAPVAAHGVTQRDFEVEDKVYQLGLPPRRIDILTSISGVTFDEAVAEAIEGRLGPVKVRFIGKAAWLATSSLPVGRKTSSTLSCSKATTESSTNCGASLCTRRDLNPHALRRRNLNPVRLPIPPLVRGARRVLASAP